MTSSVRGVGFAAVRCLSASDVLKRDLHIDAENVWDTAGAHSPLPPEVSIVL